MDVQCTYFLFKLVRLSLFFAHALFLALQVLVKGVRARLFSHEFLLQKQVLFL